LNLFWLKYVSYAFLAGAAFFYIVLRSRFLRLSRTVKLSMYAACIVLACLVWHVQETNAAANSPRKLIIGTVAWVSANQHKSGTIADDFQLKTGSASLSPEFSTDNIADSMAQQPIRMGDTLGVLYRTWDNVPLTIDELEGQHHGWHYSRYDDDGAYIFSVALVGLIGFIAAFFASRDKSKPAAAHNTILGDSGS